MDDRSVCEGGGGSTLRPIDETSPLFAAIGLIKLCSAKYGPRDCSKTSAPRRRVAGGPPALSVA